MANAENAAGGSGLTPAIYRELIAAGIDVITLGDHVYRRREIFSVLESEPRIVRPANYPGRGPGPRAGGRPHRRRGAGGGVRPAGPGVHAAGRLPFPGRRAGAGRRCPADVRVILLDFHAEATSDKQIMGRHLDGRVTRRAGHPHPRADRRRADPARRHGLPVRRGHDRPAREHSGRRIDRVLETTLTFRPTHFEVATGDVRLHGTLVEADPATGLATAIRRIRVDQAEAERLAAKHGTGSGEQGTGSGNAEDGDG